MLDQVIGDPASQRVEFVMQHHFGCIAGHPEDLVSVMGKITIVIPLANSEGGIDDTLLVNRKVIHC